MTDTVTRLMELADKYAANYRAHYTPAGCENVNIADARQALEAELTRLFTPLSDEQMEVACSAAAKCGNKRGVKSFDALAIVGAYLSETNKHGIGKTL